MQLVFELDSMKSSKELWSTSRGYAEFYTEPRRRIQEEPDPQSEFHVTMYDFVRTCTVPALVLKTRDQSFAELGLPEQGFL